MECKKDFPIFQESNIVYLDNAATTQKPETVINSFRIYEKYNGNVHRCPHKWGRLMTDEYERARQKAADFFHVKESGTVIFTRGATEGINLVASSYLPYVAEDRNEVVVTVAEHHSNFVPWQQWCRKTGKKLIVLPTVENENVDLQMLEEAITERTALVAMAHLTNVFGILQPVEEAAKLAKEGGYDYFTTTLTISPLKNAAWLNELGQKAGELAGVRFLPSDFKKKGGYQRSIQLSKEYNLYRQNFCGCVFSKRESEERMHKEKNI